MKSSDVDPLLMRYLDGKCTPAEQVALNHLLESDLDARNSLREIAMHAVCFADLAREEELARSRIRRVQPEPSGYSWSKPMLAVAAAIMMLVGASTVWLVRDRAEVITVGQTSGAVSWIATDGSSRSTLQPGDQVRGGTLRVDGAAGAAELIFPDGTTIATNGDTELVLPSGPGKHLALRRGAISADVRAQPANRPMLIRTPTAQIEVLGTRFYLSAQTVETAISVESGQVRIRRLADEQTVSVAKGQLATASLNAEEPMEAAPLPPAPTAWRQTFEQPPPQQWRGKWQSADGNGPGRLQNVPDFSHRRPDGTPVAAYTVNVRDKLGVSASISPETVLRVKFRTARPRPVLVLTGLHQPTGWFAGNFQTMIQPGTLQADADGWYTWQSPLSRLKERCPTDAQIPDGGRVFLIYLACYSPKVQLEVAEIAIESPHARSTETTAAKP